jgi:hypothetical protein
MRTTPTESPVFELKPLSNVNVDTAIDKAEHYRLLNQPRLAESICLDVLEIDPENQRATIVLLLSLTDLFSQSTTGASKLAFNLASKLKDSYAQVYYTGIINERLGAAALNSTSQSSDFDAYEWYREAMDCFEKAQEINKGENNDPILRWNTCARIIMDHHLRERPSDDYQPMLE